MSFSEINGFNKFLDTPTDILAQRYVEHPEEYREKYLAIIRGVLDQPCSSPSELKKGKAFLAKIEAINTKAKESDMDPPFKISAMVLHRKFEKDIGPKLTSSESSSIHKLKGVFEKQVAESSVKPQPPTASTAKKKVVFGTPRTFANLKERIKALTVSDPELAKKISAIKEELNTLNSSELSEEKKKELLGALTTLTDPHAFRASTFEWNFLEHCSAGHPKFKEAMAGFDAIDKQVQQKTRKELLTAIKDQLDRPFTLNAHIKKLNEELPKQHISEMRVEGPPFNKHFVDHFPKLIHAYEKFSLDTHKHVSDSWKTYAETYDSDHGEGFTKLLENYPYMNPRASFAELSQMQEEEFFKLLDLNHINNNKNIEEYLTSVKTKSEKLNEQFFDKVYALNYLGKHVWLEKNLGHIVKPYNQSEALHTNLGEGVCFQNCLDRNAALLKKPDTPDQELQTGSTQTGRYHQSKMGSELESQKKAGTLTSAEAMRIQTDSAKRLGMVLKESEKITGETSEKLHANLSQALRKHYKKGDQRKVQCVLVLVNKSGGGHAINIQIDHAAGQYRFIDDNLGVCSEYRTPKEFIDSLIEYLPAYYDDTARFDLQFYTPKT